MDKAELQKLIEQKGFIPHEDQEQKELAQWLDLHKILWCHVPNGGKRNVITARKLKGHGVKAGVPDVLIFDVTDYVTTRVDSHCPGIAIELKRQRKGQTSPEQKQWLDDLTARGWITKVCNGANEAITFLESLGYGRKK
jgi:hypothetical protein